MEENQDTHSSRIVQALIARRNENAQQTSRQVQRIIEEQKSQYTQLGSAKLEESMPLPEQQSSAATKFNKRAEETNAASGLAQQRIQEAADLRYKLGLPPKIR